MDQSTANINDLKSLANINKNSHITKNIYGKMLRKMTIRKEDSENE